MSGSEKKPLTLAERSARLFASLCSSAVKYSARLPRANRVTSAVLPTRRLP